MPAVVAPVVVEYVPAPQSVHVTLPVTVLNFPATQAVHVPPSGPVEPAGHANGTQSSSVSLPIGEVNPAAHATQAVSAVAPVLVRYLPAPHATQAVSAVAPVLVRYLPAMQSVQPSLPVPDLYLPASQALHAINPEFVKPAGHCENLQVPSACSMNPGMQTQLLRDEAPGTEVVVLAGQALH